MAVVLLGIWEMTVTVPEATEPLSEYELLTGGADQEARVPPPSSVIALAIKEIGNPFVILYIAY